MVGVPVRVHDLEANDLGIAHLPWQVEIGDIVEEPRGDDPELASYLGSRSGSWSGRG